MFPIYNYNYQDDGSTTSLTSYWPFNSKKKPRRFVEDGFDLDLTCKTWLGVVYSL